MKISEVSEKTDFSADTLRYYERIGLLAPVPRTESGIRDYQEKDIQRIEFIQCMRKAGIPLKALNEYIRLVEEGDSTTEARKAILIKQRDELLIKLQEMQETLDLLNYKIKVYEERVLKAENEMILKASHAERNP